MRFHLDVGLGDVLSGSADWLEGSGSLSFADIPPATAAVIPIAQQFAEKVHAYTYPWQERLNTRDKDLIDLVLILETQPIDPLEIHQALIAVFEHRKTHPLPAQFPEPPAAWTESFRAQAQELKLNVSTLDAAYQLLAKFWTDLHIG